MFVWSIIFTRWAEDLVELWSIFSLARVEESESH